MNGEAAFCSEHGNGVYTMQPAFVLALVSVLGKVDLVFVRALSDAEEHGRS
jgi:hypothetical protein